MNPPRKWINTLRQDNEAWQDLLHWLGEQRMLVLERVPANWDAEKERQGEKKMLDNILHLCTIDQKEELQRSNYNG